MCAALVAILALVAGCGERISDRRATNGDAQQLVTAGFGADTLSDGPAPAGGSVMDALRAATPVTTKSGGEFVDGMFNRATSDSSAWLYYVNGVLAERGAAEEKVRAGDRVWWDYHDFTGPEMTAVVGAWPQPFVNGYPETPQAVNADAPLAAPLRAAGVRVSDVPSPWRVRVGTDAELRTRDPAWKRAAQDPDDAGLAVRITGGRVVALGADGTTFRPVPRARAIAVAVTSDGPEDSPGVLLAVVGLDAPAATAAANRIARDGAVLRNRFAVAFDASGDPVATGGRETP